MKLYEIPRNSYIKVENSGATYHFHHVDGMYSYCTTDKGEVIHLFAGTDADIVEQPPNFGQKNEFD